MIFDVKIEKRENFDAMSERETISIQNINFFDVANDENIFFDVDINMTNEIKKNEISKIDFAKLINDVIIKIDSFVDENVAKNVNIAIIDFDVNFANSFIVILTNSLDVNVAKNVDFAIDIINVRFAITVFDVKKNVNVAISFNVNFAISFDIIKFDNANIANSFVNFFNDDFEYVDKI